MSEPAGQTPAKNSVAKRLFVIAFVAITLLVAGISVWTNLTRWKANDSAHAQSARPVPLKETELEIRSGEKVHRFSIELAKDDAMRAKGLMFRTSMAQDAGMLFDFGADTPVSMWMKNTYISLDMLFIKADGTIHRIAERTEPMSERTVSAGAPVRAVLELNGGVASTLGLKPGDKVNHPMFPAK